MAAGKSALAARARGLARLNARMLRLFDARTLAALRAVAPLTPVLAHLEPLLVRNLAKEIEKDARVIAAAADLIARGEAPDAAAVQSLLEASRRIDQGFLTSVGAFPVRIVIRYEEVLPFRRRRVQRLLDVSYAVLRSWSKAGAACAAIRSSHRASELEAALDEILRLYTSEVQALSRSVRLPLLLVPLRELAAQRLSAVMCAVGTRLAHDVTAAIFRARAGASGAEELRRSS
jgi:hypothetical protein